MAAGSVGSGPRRPRRPRGPPGATAADALARTFTRARATRVEEILKALVSLGQAREVEGRYLV